ncbi:DNA polymerase III subunit beta [Corynebacterium ulceribovis]|uniref:DNA polymerase III subunit beta n=1 Tax=Corynebacterium ulceribovis TaxID=487732 RepID=UPI0004782E83|nr:DNA polymerase III subunit beta [Corynebacterium ulceribovis]
MQHNDVSFRAPKNELADAVSWVARSLPARPAQAILRGMVITADDNGLELAGYDYEVSTQVRIPAEVAEIGRFAVNGKLFAEIIAKLPNKPIDVTVDGSRAKVACGSSKFDLPLMNLDDYPQLPSVPAVTGTIDPNLFTEAIGQVAVAAGRDETLPMLTGIRMEVEGKQVVLAATDRFRLAVRSFEWDPAQDDVQAALLIPSKTLSETARTLDTSSSEPVQFAVGTGSAEEIGSDGLLGIVDRQRQTTTRLLDAEFPKFRPLLPKTHSAIATIEIQPLLDAIQRVALLADRSAQIRMNFSDGQVELSAGGAEEGSAQEVVPCAFVGEDSLMIAFNYGYLKDGLSAVHTPRVVIGFTQPSRPAILIPEPEELPEADADGNFPTPETDFTYLLMPVRLPG